MRQNQWRKTRKTIDQGQVINLMEMTQMMLLYGEVHIDIFIYIQTTPLELKAGTEKLNKSSNIFDNGTILENESQQVRDDKYFPGW